MKTKEWKERPISIGEFEDLWEANNRFEVAKAYILLLKDAKSISFEEKVKFLVKVDSHSNCLKDNYELIALTEKTFLELVPAWNGEFESQCCSILYILGDRIPFEYKKGWEGKIKTFIHSYLNTHKKEDDLFWNEWLPQILINNGMFEELVNYDFTSYETIKKLGSIIFPDNENPFLYKGSPAAREKLTQALKENREPHVLSTLLRLLAKRGDLEKIFQAQ